MQQDLMTRLDIGAPQVSSRSADPSSGGNSSSSSPSSSAAPNSQQFPSWLEGASTSAPQPVTSPPTPAPERFQPRPDPQPSNNSTPEVWLAPENIQL